MIADLGLRIADSTHPQYYLSFALRRVFGGIANPQSEIRDPQFL
jgi:hypothetical protein